MRTEKQAGHDGAFIDPDDLERAAAEIQRLGRAARTGEKVVRGAAEWKRRLRLIRSMLAVLLLSFGAFILAGLLLHAIVWILWEGVGYPIRLGWGWWPT